MASTTIRNVVTGAKHILDGALRVATIGELKSKIEIIMDIPSEKLILVGRNGRTLLLDNDLELSNRLEMSVIDVYTKISSPESVEIEIVAGTDRHKLTVSSHETFAHLRMKVDNVLEKTVWGRTLITLQAVMSNGDDQLFEYLLAPLPEGSVQVIRVFEDDPPSSRKSASSSDQPPSDQEHPPPSDQGHPPSSRFNCCCNM